MVEGKAVTNDNSKDEVLSPRFNEEKEGDDILDQSNTLSTFAKKDNRSRDQFRSYMPSGVFSARCESRGCSRGGKRNADLAVFNLHNFITDEENSKQMTATLVKLNPAVMQLAIERKLASI